MELESNAVAKLLLNEWLSDSVINAYGALLKKRADQNPSLPRIFVADSFFYTSYLQNGPSQAAGRFKAVNILELDFIIIPCNINNVHWILSVIDLRSHLVIIFDSIYNDATAQTVLSALKGFLSFILENSWDASTWSCYPAVCPQQENNSDCGLFTLVCAEAVARRAEICIPPALRVGNSLRIEIKKQLFNDAAAQISMCAGELYRPSCFLWPPRPQFTFADVLLVPNPQPRIITDVIDLDSPSPPQEESPTSFLNSLNLTPATASPPQSTEGPQPVPSSLTELRRYVVRTAGKKRPDRQALKFKDGSVRRFYPSQAVEFLRTLGQAA